MALSTALTMYSNRELYYNKNTKYYLEMRLLNMKEYLEYLEKLNSLVDVNEIIFKSARATVIKDRKRSWDWTFWLSLLVGILSIGGTIVTMVNYYYHQGTWLTPLVVGMMCVLSWALSTVAASKSIEYYNVLLDLEYASPVDSSYAIVRNTIIDDGNEFMKKLFEWERLYALTEDERLKCKYVLEVIRSLRADFEIIESGRNK